MPKAGLEPPRACAHCALNAARLPVPPLRRGGNSTRWRSRRQAEPLTRLAVAYHLPRDHPVPRTSPPPQSGKQSVARNPKATHDYHVLETWEAGIVLTGTEVKSLRNGKASIKEAYARVQERRSLSGGMNITPYEQGNRYNHDPVRTRKLLLHRREIEQMIGAVEQQGLTLIPLELYFKNGRAKVALALGKGKKQHDKRETSSGESPSAKPPAPWPPGGRDDRTRGRCGAPGPPGALPRSPSPPPAASRRSRSGPRPGAPVLSASELVAALGGTVRISGSWAEVAIGRQPFRFLLGAPYFSWNDRPQPLTAAASLVRRHALPAAPVCHRSAAAASRGPLPL